ncbi:hypothetical protein CHCC14821_0217 [Bacillus paralicheniformis]|nr:hypothetical protein CHCC14821_0217 [Bacillus paralicheniformis]TWM54150.1 hypothetical protein CHCC14814_2958 [Bacillus paralicheniformis]
MSKNSLANISFPGFLRSECKKHEKGYTLIRFGIVRGSNFLNF